MTNSERVQALHKKHNTWLLACCYNLTQDKDKAEDLLQEVYLHLLEMKDLQKIIYNETDLNLFYTYKIIKSKFLNNEKSKKKIDKISLKEELVESHADEEYNLDSDSITEMLLELVKDTLDKDLHWFDSKLFITYIEEEHSIQSLHEATKISKNSIFNSLSKTKKLIRQKAKENDLHY